MLPSIENSTLLQGLIDEDPRSFELLYKNLYPLLFAKAKSLLQDEFKASDAVHDTFVKLWEKKEIFRSIKSRLDNYLLTMVHNRCLNELNLQSRTHLKQKGYAWLLDEEDTDNCLSMEWKNEEKKHAQIIDLLPGAVNELALQQRLAIEKCYFEGKRQVVAAQEMNLDKRTVHSHLRDAYKMLRKKIARLE
jgi:RNA polymerase sigma-70 factor (ECF subfamily)